MIAADARGTLPSSLRSTHLSLLVTRGASGWRWECWNARWRRSRGAGEGVRCPEHGSPAERSRRPSWLHPFPSDV